MDICLSAGHFLDAGIAAKSYYLTLFVAITMFGQSEIVRNEAGKDLALASLLFVNVAATGTG